MQYNFELEISELRPLGFTITGWTDVQPGSPIGVDRGLSLLSLQIDRDPADTTRATVQDGIEAPSVEIAYESIYEETFSTADISSE